MNIRASRKSAHTKTALADFGCCKPADRRLADPAIAQPERAVLIAQGIIRIVEAKGRKDRNVMLSKDILDLLREWWKERPTGQDKDVPAPERVLFPSDCGNHLSARQT